MSAHWQDEQQPRRSVKDWAQLANTRLDSLRAAQAAGDDLLFEAEQGIGRSHGQILSPVMEKSRALARQPWGKAWMRQLGYSEQQGMTLAPGRSLLRHGCVLHLEMAPGCIRALVSADEIVELKLELDLPDEDLIASLRERCSAEIDSLVALLAGRIDASLMAQLCEPEAGLLPLPHEWQMSCSCPDWTEPCSHAAAAIYAAGCLIDTQPEQLFMLRGLSPIDFLSRPEAAESDFDAAALSDTFGIDLDWD